MLSAPPIPPPPLHESDRAVFVAFVKHLGDIAPVTQSCAIDEMDFFVWFAKPHVQAWLDYVTRHRKLNNFLHISNALPEAIAKLRELMRTHPDIDGQRKCAAHLSRLHPTPRAERKLTDSFPGKTLDLDNVCDHAPTPPLDASSLDSSMPGCPDASPLAPHTSAQQPVERANARCQTRQRLEADTQHHQAHEMGERGSAHSPLDASSLDASTPSPRDSSHTFGLSPAQLSAYPTRELHHLTRIPCSDGTVTIFDPRDPFAGFGDDHLTHLDGPAFDIDTELALQPYIRPCPECPVDFSLPDLESTDSFPTLDPRWFPKPRVEASLPNNLKDLSDLRITPDVALTIARGRRPWLCLPCNGQGKPDRKAIRADLNGPYAFRKLHRALFDARNLARAAWAARWRTAELARILVLKNAGKLPPLPDSS